MILVCHRYFVSCILLVASIVPAIAQNAGARDPTYTVHVRTGLGSFTIPLGYLAGTQFQLNGQPSEWPGLAVAFWMPSGLPLKEPYIEKPGRPLPEAAPPTPKDFLFVVYYNPSEKLVDPLVQFGNITSANDRGLEDFQFTRVGGLLRLSHSMQMTHYYGGHFVSEQKNRDSVFVDCFSKEAAADHPICGGTAQLDAISSRFRIEIPAAHVDRTLSCLAMFFRLLAAWRDTPFTLNEWSFH